MKVSRIQNYLCQPVDNTSLVVFRIAFGFLIAAESFGAIMTGWVKRVFIDTDFTFRFIGFEWLHPWPGDGMYYYYALMGICGLLVMIGLFYRYSLGLFTLLWWASYLMQKSSYNNHYYLLILLCFLMLIVPAHHNSSLDSRRSPHLLSTTCPKWCIDIFIWQLLIVYTYAALAKLYPGWLEGDFIARSFSGKAHYPIIGDILQRPGLQKLVTYGGFLFDLTIIPLMLSRVTRKFGLMISVVFHLFNSIVFGIGIFPYLMIASLVLFFPIDHWRPRIPGYQLGPDRTNNCRFNIMMPVLMIYFIFQLWLPIRHNFIEGNVFRTEEGHRMSWRMMLRSKSGSVSFKIVDLKNKDHWMVYPRQYLSKKQAYKIAGHPDMIWQFSRYLSKIYQKQGLEDIEIYAVSNYQLNGKEMGQLIDPEVNLLSVPWKRFGHNDWIVTEAQ